VQTPNPTPRPRPNPRPQVGEDEGYAAELMIEFMYSGRLPQDAPPTELLRMIRLADQYQVQRFLSACNASFDGLPLDGLDLGVALSVFALPPLMLESEALAKVVRKVEQKVQAVFGDLEAVWAAEGTRDAFMQLPFRAVLSLLGSEETAGAWLGGVGGAVEYWGLDCLVLLLWRGGVG